MRTALLVCMTVVGGCDDHAIGNGDLQPIDLGVDAAPPGTLGPYAFAPFTPAPHSPLPPIPANSGKVLTTVNLVTITYSGYSYVSQAEALGDFIFTSNWFAAVSAGYGVHNGTHVKKVHVPGPPPPDDSTVTDVIASLIDAGTVPAPTADPSTTPLYLVYYPAASSSVGCNGGYAGYHDASTHEGKSFAYGVVLDCGDGASSATHTASHEIIEAATDPYLDGYYTTGFGALEQIGIGEVGDLCETETILEGGFTLQRSWSNIAAAAGGNPCAPSPEGDLYYNVSSSPAGIPVAAANSQVVFTLTGWSLGRVADWSVSAESDDSGIPIVLSGTQINNGKSVTLTVTVPDYAPGSLVFVNVLSSPRGSIWPIEMHVQ